MAGAYAMWRTPVDAVPDLSENQVIVFTDWMGRSPREIEDQVTYPLSRKLQGLSGVRAVRSSSEFNFSMITIIFEEGIDFYFARQRVSEKLSGANTFLPAGVVPYLAPDATALGLGRHHRGGPAVRRQRHGGVGGADGPLRHRGAHRRHGRVEIHVDELGRHVIVEHAGDVRLGRHLAAEPT